MPVLDATIGGRASNSYLTIEQANQLATLVLSGAAHQAFTSQAETQKEVCLMRATRMIERSFEWPGYKVDDLQALAWPRYANTNIFAAADTLIYGAQVLPNDVLDAVLLLASHLALGFNEADTLASPATKVKIGPISLDFDSSKSKSRATIPEDVISALSRLGSYTGLTSGGRAISIERS